MSLRSALNRGNPNSLPSYLQSLEIGSILAGLPTLRSKFNFNASGTSAKHVATVHHMPLDPGIKAASILRAFARAGTAGTGELTVAANNATPTTGQIAVAPNGDIVTLAADALTDVDVLFVPFKCDVITLDLAVVPGTGVAVIPAVYVAQGVQYLDSAEALSGTVTGVKRILVPGATNPATPQVRLSAAKNEINFTVADAVTKARVTLALNPKVDVYGSLIAEEKF